MVEIDNIDCFWYPELAGCDDGNGDGGNNGNNGNEGGDNGNGQGNQGGDGGASEGAKVALME